MYKLRFLSVPRHPLTWSSCTLHGHVLHQMKRSKFTETLILHAVRKEYGLLDMQMNLPQFFRHRHQHESRTLTMTSSIIQSERLFPATKAQVEKTVCLSLLDATTVNFSPISAVWFFERPSIDKDINLVWLMKSPRSAFGRHFWGNATFWRQHGRVQECMVSTLALIRTFLLVFDMFRVLCLVWMELLRLRKGLQMERQLYRMGHG